MKSFTLIVAATTAIAISTTADARDSTGKLNNASNCILGSPDYDACARNRENELNSIRNLKENEKAGAPAYMEPASGGNPAITGNNNIRIEQTAPITTPGSTANPAQR